MTSSACVGSDAVGFTSSSGAVCQIDAALHATYNTTGSSSCFCS